MAIQQNGYFNDPNIGAAFGSLAQAFQPPSASDMYASAKATETRQKVKQLADLFDLAKNPNLDRAQFDRMGIAAGNYTPSQSYYSVDTANATSRYNNAADNTRALQQTGIQERGQLDRAMIAPIGRDASRVLPPGLAKMYGVPTVQTGVIEMNPGASYQLPDGTVKAGPAKPLTEDQIKAAVLDRLPDSEKRAMVLAGVPVEAVQTPEGARLAFRVDAIGKAPAPKAEDQTEVSKLIRERDSLPQGDPNRAAYNARIQALGRGQQQSKYDQANEESLVKLNEEISNTALKSSSNLATLNRLSQALREGAQTGKFGNVSLEARKAAEALGIPVGDVSNEEVLRSLGNQFALKLRDPSQGAGMPGSLSDSDRAFLAAMSVGLENSPQGNAKLIDYFSRVNRRNLEIENLRKKYIAQSGGRIDEAFRSQVSDFAQANPLFADQPGYEDTARSVIGPAGIPVTSPQAAGAQEFKILGVRKP